MLHSSGKEQQMSYGENWVTSGPGCQNGRKSCTVWLCS